MKPVPTSSMLEMLTPIWQRVLQVSSCEVDDNFFDVGGDSALALELFHEIALACGRELPPVMIYQTPTIAALAAVLEQPATIRVPPLVQLKPGNEEPPIFIAHGLGGSALDFYQIVKRFPESRAVYGMQAKGIDGIEQPLETVEEMARYALDAVQQIQPHGPYFLIGFSLGGLMVLEMAQQLNAMGERIELLTLLDSYPHVSLLSWTQRTRLWARRTWRRAARRLQWLGVSPPYQTTLEVPAPPSQQRFRDLSYRALERYEPRFYPGKINFVRAAIPTDFPADPVAVWSKLAHQFAVETVPGDHLGIMTTHSDELASALSRSLHQARLE